MMAPDYNHRAPRRHPSTVVRIMSPENVTSLSLLQRVRVRDALAWERLVALYRPLVLSWCQRGGARREDADDLAQEVFLAVAGGLEKFRREGEGSFRSWVRGI